MVKVYNIVQRFEGGDVLTTLTSTVTKNPKAHITNANTWKCVNEATYAIMTFLHRPIPQHLIKPRINHWSLTQEPDIFGGNKPRAVLAKRFFSTSSVKVKHSCPRCNSQDGFCSSASRISTHLFAPSTGSAIANVDPWKGEDGRGEVTVSADDPSPSSWGKTSTGQRIGLTGQFRKAGHFREGGVLLPRRSWTTINTR